MKRNSTSLLILLALGLLLSCARAPRQKESLSFSLERMSIVTTL